MPAHALKIVSSNLDIAQLEREKDELSSEIEALEKRKSIAEGELKSSVQNFTKNIQEKQKELDEHVMATKASIDQLMTKCLEVGKSWAKYEAITPLFILLDKTEGKPETVLPLVLKIVERLREWSKKYPLKSQNFNYALDRLIVEIKGALGID